MVCEADRQDKRDTIKDWWFGYNSRAAKDQFYYLTTERRNLIGWVWSRGFCDK